MQRVLGHTGQSVPIKQIASKSYQEPIQVHAEIFQGAVGRAGTTSEAVEDEECQVCPLGYEPQSPFNPQQLYHELAWRGTFEWHS